MNLEDVRKRLNGAFRPFTIHTSDGRSFPAPHKEFVFLTRRSVIVGDEDGFVDIIDPLHITSLRELGGLPSK